MLGSGYRVVWLSLLLLSSAPEGQPSSPRPNFYFDQFCRDAFDF